MGVLSPDLWDEDGEDGTSAYFLDDEEPDLFLLRSISRYSRSLALRVAKLSEPPPLPSEDGDDLSWLEEAPPGDFPEWRACFLDFSLAEVASVSEFERTSTLLPATEKGSTLGLRWRDGSPVGVERFMRREELRLKTATGVEEATGDVEEVGIVEDTVFRRDCLSVKPFESSVLAC